MHVDFRQFKIEEAGVLDVARQEIRNHPALSLEEKNLAILELNALACAEVRCADGVPVVDVNYQNLRSLQDYGEKLQNAGIEIDQFLGEVVDPDLFNYSKSDWVGDQINKYDEAWMRVGGVVQAGGGAVMMYGGMGLTIAGGISCAPSAGLGCFVMVGGGGMTYLGHAEAEEGFTRAFSDYESQIGNQVLASFSVDSHMGDSSALVDALKRGGIFAGEMAVGRLGGRYLGLKIDEYKQAHSGASGYEDVVPNSGNAVELANGWQTKFPYIGQDPMRPVALQDGKLLAQVVFEADAMPGGSYFTTPSAIRRATLADGSIDANILNQGLQIDASKYSNFRANIQYFRVDESIPYGDAAFGRAIENTHLNPGNYPALPQVFIKQEYLGNLTAVDRLGNPSITTYPMINTQTPTYPFVWIPKR